MRWFAGLRSVGLSKKVCRHSPVCWCITDSRVSRSRSRRMAKLAQREVVDFQVKVVPPFGINEQDFVCSPRRFTAQQARAQLCDPSGWDCVMFLDQFMCKGFHQIGINVSRQLELSYPSCARCFPLMSILPLGAATAVTPMWIALHL